MSSRLEPERKDVCGVCAQCGGPIFEAQDTVCDLCYDQPPRTWTRLVRNIRRLLDALPSGDSAQTVASLFDTHPVPTEEDPRPLDPECPEAIEFRALSYSTEDITAAFEQSHRKRCWRCRDFGGVNKIKGED